MARIASKEATERVMSIITPDVSTRLKPDFIKVVNTIYTEMCALASREKVLVLSDARTPDHIVATFQGVAMSLGAEAVTMESAIPPGGPTYQPMVKWSPMVAAAAMEADLIVDLAVGYADFMPAALDKGTRVIMPGDGIGGPYLDDMLIRTVGDCDIHAVRREADRVAEAFSAARSCRMLTGEGQELVVDISDLEGAASDGFLWDMDRNDWKTSYAILPPAQPGVAIPKGRGDGTVSVDGTLLWHPIYHERPRDPLILTFENGKLVDAGGDKYLAGRLIAWLKQLGDDGARHGPVHLNIGVNPNALLTQNQEWERVYGSVTCGMGDMSLGGSLFARGQHAPSWVSSGVHWDWTVMQPVVLLDDRVVAENGVLFGGTE
jgi:leucyl aminopeptidase (aminopeptidase T)